MIDLATAVHKACSCHVAALRQSVQAVCFYCCRIFSPNEMTDRIKGPLTMGLRDGRSALCPYCGIDPVLPDTHVPLSTANLTHMHQRWFQT